jgi:chromosome condensin MukBEF ATPase and DNA-binding subunit MukB
MTQPLWLSVLTASVVAAVVSFLGQLIMWRLTGQREARTWSRQVRLQAATEFITSCETFWEAVTNYGMRSTALDNARPNAQSSPEAFEQVKTQYLDANEERERQRRRSREALAVMRLHFPALATRADDYWRRCSDGFDEAFRPDPKLPDRERMRDELVKEIASGFNLV